MKKNNQQLTPLGRVKTGPPKRHDIIQTFRDVMELKGLTQHDVARLCGYTRKDGTPNPSRVSAWLTDNPKYHRNISLQQLEHVCTKAFDMTLVAFFTSSAEYNEQSVAETEINKIMKDMTADQNEALISIARALREPVLEAKMLREKLKTSLG